MKKILIELLELGSSQCVTSLVILMQQCTFKRTSYYICMAVCVDMHYAIILQI